MNSKDRLTSDAFDFLTELKANNERDWFLRNKERYEECLQLPVLALIEQLGPALNKISPFLVANAKPTGGSMLRIYRDTRFSKDKAPYKTYVAAKFFHSEGKDEPAPVFYLHIDTEHAFFACGVWRPAPELRTRIARAIASNPGEWIKVSQSKSFTKFWTIGGEMMKKMPRGFDPDHELAEELRRKEFIAFKTFAQSEVTNDNFTSELKEAIRAASPFMKFLTHATGFPWDSTDPPRRVDPLNKTFKSSK